MYRNGIQSYRRTNVITSDPGKLVLMCYEGIIDQLKIAKERYEANDYEAKCKALKKAEDILGELVCSLDFDKGGAIARNLESLYNYMTRRIILADVSRDLNAIDDVIWMLSELLSAWEDIFSKKAVIPAEKVGFDEQINPEPSLSVGL
jgi:flagellar protein FliS